MNRRASNAKGYAFVAALVLLVLVLGWRVATLIAPERNAAVTAPSLPDEPPSYLVYRTYRVTDRGTEEWANDDVLAHEFHRYPLDRPADPEIFARATEDNSLGHGAPWMAALGDRRLLFVRRQNADDDALVIDVDGREVAFSGFKGPFWGALPSPDGKWVATPDESDPKAVVLTSAVDGRVRKLAAAKKPALGYMAPLVWSDDARTLYLRPRFEGEAFTTELWELDIESGKISEITSVRKLGLMHFSVVPSLGKVVGSSFQCEDLERCGTGPSSLSIADLEGGQWHEVLSDDSLGFAEPILSPDGTKIAFSYFGNDRDTWIVDVDDPGSRRLLISGVPVAWTPDGASLVVDRDNALQLVRLSDRTVTEVAERKGRYNDPDFQGLDFIGILRGNE